ncbi:MAG: HisA/HisF-related TIM barrel protein [Methylococcales bacterium]|nr:HisA/HisF-related TIM barrel protein [Methylococcales bacterium]
MKIIPVIDIKQGVAVHAKLGLRQHYQPLKTPLCHSYNVTEVIQCFLQLHPFTVIYLADLDAILDEGDNDALIETLRQHYPNITFWVDRGFQASPSSLSVFSHYQTVLGSESYGEDKVSYLKNFEKEFILSLDFSANGESLGAKQLFYEQDLWPKKIILMTLGRVGSYQGVDLDLLMRYQRLNSKIELIASGGVRGITDLFALQKIGIHAVLCASALHNKAISSRAIKKLQAKKYPE